APRAARGSGDHAHRGGVPRRRRREGGRQLGARGAHAARRRPQPRAQPVPTRGGVVTDGPTTRQEAFELVAAITARALRRAAAYDAEHGTDPEAADTEALTRRSRPLRSEGDGPDHDHPHASEATDGDRT